jgi:type IV pilus assembly protein PilC
MPTFSYSARDAGGKSHDGTLTVDTRESLISQLRQKGLTPTSIAEGSGARAAIRGVTGARAGAKSKKTPLYKIKPGELVVITRQLATIVNAGLPLMQGLDILAEQSENVQVQAVLRQIAADVQAGESFSDALRKHPRAFSKLYVSMIRAGEASGNLDGILLRLAEYMEATEDLKRKVRSAMTYPTVAFTFVMLIAVGLIVGVVPQFEDIFDQLGAELPAITKMLMLISDILRKNILWVLAGLIIAIVAIRFAITKTTKGRYIFDQLTLRLPIFGKILAKVSISRFTRTLSTLTRSGVPILGALEIVESTAGNAVFARAISQAQDSVRAGQPLAEPLMAAGVFPTMVTRMISVGEKTGALEALLSKIADFYDSEVDATVAALTSLIEPLLIVMLGVIVGFIVIALFLPIFALSGAISGSTT